MAIVETWRNHFDPNNIDKDRWVKWGRLRSASILNRIGGSNSFFINLRSNRSLSNHQAWHNTRRQTWQLKKRLMRKKIEMAPLIQFEEPKFGKLRSLTHPARINPYGIKIIRLLTINEKPLGLNGLNYSIVFKYCVYDVISRLDLNEMWEEKRSNSWLWNATSQEPVGSRRSV